MAAALRLAASAGIALTLVVLAVSVWLRVHTTLDAPGNPVSWLPAASEHGLRLLHRTAASGVGLVALACAVLVVRSRPIIRERLLAVALVLAMTLALAVAGPLTPGYRLPGITVVNVAAGIALAAGFLWLGLSAPNAPPGCVPGVRPGGGGLAVAALGIAFTHAVLGAAASAHTMQRAPIDPQPWHVGIGFAVTAMCVVVAAHGKPGDGSPWRAALALAALAQLSTGLAIAATGEASAPGIALFHAMLAAAVVLALVRIVRHVPRIPASS